MVEGPILPAFQSRALPVPAAGPHSGLTSFQKDIYLFIWLHWVAVIAQSLFQHVRSRSLIRYGTHPVPLHWKLGVLATRPPGKSLALSLASLDPPTSYAGPWHLSGPLLSILPLACCFSFDQTF